MKSEIIPWTARFSAGRCPCGSGKFARKCCWRGRGQWEKSPVGPIKVSGSNFKHPRCYLSSLGNCSTKITREHFISRNILQRITNSTLKFENAAHFFGGKANVEIGVDAFSSKILCDNHNSSLSILDASAGLTFDIIESFAADAVKGFTGHSTVKAFCVASGLDVERWLIKVHCGLVATGKIRSHSGRILAKEPLQDLLYQTLMGNASLFSPLGLHMHTRVGQNLHPGRISFSTVQLTDGSDDVGGLMMSLGILNFVLITSPRFGQTFTEPNWYRHQCLSWNAKRGGSRLGFLFTY